MRIVQSSSKRDARLRNAILLGVTVAAGLGLGFLLSYDIDEEAHYQRSITAQNKRIREQAQREREARRAQAESAHAQATRDSAATQQSRVHTLLQGPSCRGAIRGRCALGLDGAAYVFETARTTMSYGGGTTKRVRIQDDLDRVVYDEDVDALMTGRPAGVVEVAAHVFEDHGKRPRAFLVAYTSRRQGERPAAAFRIVAPREGALVALTPLLDGSTSRLPAGSQDGSLSLHAGNQLITGVWRNSAEEIVRYRVDLDCEAGTPACFQRLEGK